MSEYFLTLGVMLLFSYLCLCIRASWTVGLPDFEWRIFLFENRNRMFLAAAFCAGAAIAWMVDPVGLKTFAGHYGVPAWVASVGGIGACIGYVTVLASAKR